jgi:hypothetical protein
MYNQGAITIYPRTLFMFNQAKLSSPVCAILANFWTFAEDNTND